MSTSDDSLGERLRAYFGIGYRTDDRIEQRLTELKRRKTIRRVGWLVGVVAFAYLFLSALEMVQFTIAEIIYYWPEFKEALGGFFPVTTYFGVPFLDFGQYQQFLANQTGPSIPKAALTTLAIGFAGTVLGVPGALLFGVLGSERVTPFPFNFIFRGTMSTIRSIPALVWALIYIPLGGLSPFTATLAIGTDTVGNLGRLFTDALEEVEDGPIEAIESTGANRPQTITFGMLSQVFTPFIAWTMYILEINVRIAVTMGLIGAGGIGGILNTQRGLFNYTNMMATIIVIFVLVVSVEIISQRTRSYLRGDSNEEGIFKHLLRLVREFPQRMAESMWR
ncbi:phosphonate ABC transporter, permease protein PhnE [Halorussus limi]|uniref:Phosphonate ABC transporter, permease protein PhnE n=1 Tax=Halorussus limi TaxID=2938695 RepID=A0A8U0HXG5_9EURY|nr:phosphonate ABC transporter, permease protein PhnE [Halorussus limi]UPV75463.1 phosphonate ABC transporter, permease protein PhnE [Halorussus limi]